MGKLLAFPLEMPIVSVFICSPGAVERCYFVMEYGKVSAQTPVCHSENLLSGVLCAYGTLPQRITCALCCMLGALVVMNVI